MPRARVKTLHRRHYDTELEAFVLSVWGYRAECPCGWKGRRRFTVYVARADLHEHKVDEHGHQPDA
jgi:hypothetical protein